MQAHGHREAQPAWPPNAIATGSCTCTHRWPRATDQQGSSEATGPNERLRDAIGPCLRFSIGVDPQRSEARLDFETELAALAEEYGFGLKMDDQRLNRVRGEWSTIRGFDRERYRQARGQTVSRGTGVSPRRAVARERRRPVRTGTTAAAVGGFTGTRCGSASRVHLQHA